MRAQRWLTGALAAGLLAAAAAQAGDARGSAGELEQQIAGFVLESAAARDCHWTSDSAGDLAVKRRGVVAHLLRIALQADVITPAEAERMLADYTEPAGVAVADSVAAEAEARDGLCTNPRARRDWARWVTYSGTFGHDTRPSGDDRAIRFRTEAEQERRATLADFLQASTLAELAAQCHWSEPAAEADRLREAVFAAVASRALDQGRSPAMVVDVRRTFETPGNRATVRAAVSEDLPETGLCRSARSRALWDRAVAAPRPRD